MAASLALSLLLMLSLVSPSVSTKQTYIVHMNKHHKPPTFATHAHWFSAHLQSLSVDPSAALLYSYRSSFLGFSASLSPSEASALRSSPAVLAVYADTLYHLHTTRTPKFLGLDTDSGLGHSHQSRLDQASQDVFVGVLDTGVWPESASFSDLDMPPIPPRWRGACEDAPDFNSSSCNRKLIGARSFHKGFRTAMAYSGTQTREVDSPRDRDGHGTHTVSTVAGSPAANASLLGYAAGKARGMAPGARVAVYKVCWSVGCFGADILAGIDAAIEDGVDILSLSLGGGSAPYYRDAIAIGAFSAVQHGVFVACSAGNSGPSPSTLANAAPWIMTVGAGTLDRDFPGYVRLGNGKEYAGVSLYSGQGMGKKPLPLVYAGSSSRNANLSRLCLRGTLVPAVVRGKVVLCDRGVNARVEKGLVVREAGGAGMILANTEENGEELVADSHLLPGLAVGQRLGNLIRKYVTTNRNPKAVLSFRGTVVDVRPSPVVAAFSSRGPNTVTQEILKPDVIGPGVNILAAWSEAVGPTGLTKDPRRTNFNIMSGTSMSCPHISGIAALLKGAHPDWSPGAIKSALMTTAYTLDNTKSPLRDAATDFASTPYAYGAGHVDPQKALSPGLVYDITTEDYVSFLCSLNYTLQNFQAVVKQPNVTCSKQLSDPGNLNYPSFSVVFHKSRRVIKYSRELTNVGLAGSAYSVAVSWTAGVRVVVKPTRLLFGEIGQKLRYTVTFVSKKNASPRPAFGWITWNNKQHEVRSPIAYTWAGRKL